MIGRVTVKRVVKRAAGWAAALARPLARRLAGPRACIFWYHRIADLGFVDPHLDDWNVPPRVFERQVAALADFAEIVPLPELPRRLAAPAPPARPLVCLTFDDGYANFSTEALPILRRYQAPATVFVVTSLIGQPRPLPFDRWSRAMRDRVPPEAWRSMDWGELEGCLDSGLVTLGAHSHQHRRGWECTPAELAEEAEQSRAILSARLGEAQARMYAYPYGSAGLRELPPEYVRAVRAAGYRLAVTTDFALASPGSDPHRLPRVEAHAVDVPAVLRAKALGSLGPYHLITRLHRAMRGV
jgi:peptidoglycan/xylan/chitin deacetylase (PgdA/CDA1 family)